MNTITRTTSALTLALVGLVATAQGGTITDLYNTGAAPIGGVDPNYQLISAPTTAPAISINTNGAWVSSGANAKWIGVQTNTRGPAGSYVYRTQFTLPSHADLSSVVVSGAWASDNRTNDIVVNSSFPTGLNNNTVEFKALTPFTLTTGFQHGVNTIDFEMQNFGGPTGLLVTNLSGTFVPEPATGATLLAGLASVAVWRRR